MRTLEIEFPTENQLDQDEEYFILKGEKDEMIKFHDYRRIYETPGLYEEVFHGKLKCQSPKVITEILSENLSKSDDSFEDLNILDFGAGNGLVGEALHAHNPHAIVGIDIIEEAKEAAERDRGHVYDEYYVADLADNTNETIKELRKYELNTMVSVAALGFDHIPPDSFINAFNVIDKNGWIAFNIRDRFLTNEDESGFHKTLEWMEGNFLDILDEKTYVHRLSISGEPINYTAIVARKLNDLEHKSEN